MKKRIAITVCVATALTLVIVFGKKKLKAKIELVDDE